MERAAMIRQVTLTGLPRLTVFLLLTAMLAGGHALAQAPWHGELENGTSFAVDPSTNKAVVQSGSAGGKPLWDGVHRLRDGTTVTIRAGIVVPVPGRGPPASFVDAPQSVEATPIQTMVPRDGSDTAYCDHLVLKVCGIGDGCGAAEGCRLATQLRALRQLSSRNGDARWAEQQCQSALADEPAFPACGQQPLLPETACRLLVDHVCTDKPRCARTSLCRLAKNLGQQEIAALSQNDSELLHAIRKRCLELTGRHAFFPPCR
jgi:hypothetical protein